MKSWLDDIFSIDNLLHSLVAVFFVVLATLLFRLFLPAPPIVFAVIAALGLYVREVWQVDWDFTLRWSRHKHLEWIVGSVVGLIAAAILMMFQ